VEQTDRLLIYPNPTSDVLQYLYALSEPASISIRIVNAVGKVVFRSPAEQKPVGVCYDSVDIRGWGSGMYFVQLIKDGKVIDTKKAVKL
jgi:hypothetical protein